MEVERPDHQPEDGVARSVHGHDDLRGRRAGNVIGESKLGDGAGGVVEGDHAAEGEGGGNRKGGNMSEGKHLFRSQRSGFTRESFGGDAVWIGWRYDRGWGGLFMLYVQLHM